VEWNLALAEVEELGVGRLSEGQKDCLRLVLAHMTSKEIARRLGVSSHTVDQRLRYAIRTLGARTRMQAALKLSEAEHVQPNASLAANADARRTDAELQLATSPIHHLVHQSHDLSAKPNSGQPSESRSALGLTGLHRFAPSQSESGETLGSMAQTAEVSTRAGPAPAFQPRSAGESSTASWPLEIHLRWYHKLLAIVMIGTMLIMAAGSLVVGIEALSQLLD
jgi:DNA-binding CsgD family transcriptional regulator